VVESLGLATFHHAPSPAPAAPQITCRGPAWPSVSIRCPPAPIQRRRLCQATTLASERDLVPRGCAPDGFGFDDDGRLILRTGWGHLMMYHRGSPPRSETKLERAARGDGNAPCFRSFIACFDGGLYA
jgi:hypothetical protein